MLINVPAETQVTSIDETWLLTPGARCASRGPNDTGWTLMLFESFIKWASKY